MIRTLRRVKLFLPVVPVLLAALALVILVGAIGGVATARPNSPGSSAGMACDAVTGHAGGLDPAQERNAKIIAAVAMGRGLGTTGAAIGVAVALAESTLFNYANDGTSTLVGSAEGRQLNDAERAVARESLSYPHDKVGNNLDSIGLFQQRPMTGWGTTAGADRPGDVGRDVLRPAGPGPWLADTAAVERRADRAGLAVLGRRDLPADVRAGRRHRRRTRPRRRQPQLPLTVSDRRRMTSGAHRQVRAAELPALASPAGGGSAAWGGYANGQIPANALCPVPSPAGAAVGMRRGDGVRPTEHRVQGGSSGRTSASPTATGPSTSRSPAGPRRAACAPTRAPATTGGPRRSTSAPAAA